VDGGVNPLDDPRYAYAPRSTQFRITGRREIGDRGLEITAVPVQ